MKENRRVEVFLVALLLLPALVPHSGLAQQTGSRDDDRGRAHAEGEAQRRADQARAAARRNAMDEVPRMMPGQKTRAAFEAGLEYRDNGWKYEEEAAAETGEKAEKKAAKAAKAFRKAAGQFRRAVDLMPNFPQGWSHLGHVLRKLGEYEESAAAYDRALQIASQHPEAIESHGEAYLGLDRLEEAKGAYTQLLQIDGARADELMTAMKRGLEERRSDAGGVSEEAIEGFAAWIAEC